MRRREFILFLGGIVAAAFARTARAQNAARMARIGYLTLHPPGVEEAALTEGLKGLPRFTDVSSTRDVTGPCGIAAVKLSLFLFGVWRAVNLSALLGHEVSRLTFRNSGHKATSFDYLIGGSDQRLGDGQSECFGGLNIDRQFKLRRELHRQIRRFCPFEDAIHITGRAALQVE
jgi:hypothetical protein